METSTLKLLTIIADEALTHVLEDVLMESGAKGYTISHVEGMGASGARNNTWSGGNIKIEIITSEEVVDKALQFIHANLFDKYPIIAYYTDVNVFRTKHFI